MLVGGKVADAYGRRLIFVLGIVVFTLASLLCGLATSSEMLIGARVLQGAGAALDEPGDAVDHRRDVPTTRSAGPRSASGRASPRSRSPSDRSSAASSPSTSTGAGSSSSTSRRRPRDRRQLPLHRRVARRDARRASTCPASRPPPLGLFALTYGLIEANTYGWTSARIVGAFVLCGRLARVLRRASSAAGASPMLPLDLFRSGTYTGANLVILLVALAMFGVFFFVSLYMQNVLGYSAVADRRRVPADDDPDHPRRSRRREDERPDRVAGAHDGGHAPRRRCSSCCSRGSAIDASFWDLLPAFLIGGVGMALDVDAERGRRDAKRPGRQGGRRRRRCSTARVRSAGRWASRSWERSWPRKPAASARPRRSCAASRRALLVAAGIAVVGAIVAFTLVRPHEGAGERARSTGAPEPVA